MTLEDLEFPFERHLNRRLDGVPSGKYSMWWPTAADPTFAMSRCRDYITESYELLDGIESFVFTRIVERLELSGEKRDGRYALPEDMATFYVQGLAEASFVVSACREKGLRLHFPHSDAMSIYRDQCWEELVHYARVWRNALIKAGTVGERGGMPTKPKLLDNVLKRPHKPPGPSEPAQWWTTMLGVTETVEKNDPIQNVGTVLIP